MTKFGDRAPATVGRCRSVAGSVLRDVCFSLGLACGCVLCSTFAYWFLPAGPLRPAGGSCFYQRTVARPVRRPVLLRFRRATGGAWAPPLPAQRGPAEEPVIRAVQHRTLTAVRVDAKIKVQTLPVEHPEAVADPIVPSVLRGAEADPRRPHQAAPHRQSVADFTIEAVA